MSKAELHFSDELESALDRALTELNQDGTVVFIMEDMISIMDHFQAVLDWMKQHGNKMRRRYGPCAFMEHGVVYFVGADTHEVPTRGAHLELDLQATEHELVRKTGLEARLREKQES